MSEQKIFKKELSDNLIFTYNSVQFTIILDINETPETLQSKILEY
jgi:hypothetical protein